MGAVFSPIGGGAIGKAEAFDLLAERLNLLETPISEVRRNIFRLVFQLGTDSQNQIGNPRNPSLELEQESWALLGDLYEGLSDIEERAMKAPHADNLALFLERRAAEQAQNDAAVLAHRNAAIA